MQQQQLHAAVWSSAEAGSERKATQSLLEVWTAGVFLESESRKHLHVWERASAELPGPVVWAGGRPQSSGWQSSLCPSAAAWRPHPPLSDDKTQKPQTLWAEGSASRTTAPWHVKIHFLSLHSKDSDAPIWTSEIALTRRRPASLRCVRIYPFRGNIWCTKGNVESSASSSSAHTDRRSHIPRGYRRSCCPYAPLHPSLRFSTNGSKPAILQSAFISWSWWRSRPVPACVNLHLPDRKRTAAPPLPSQQRHALIDSQTDSLFIQEELLIKL